MIAVNGAVLLLADAALLGLFYVLRATPRATGRAHQKQRSIVMTQPAPCHVTACPYVGWHAVLLDDNTTARVCAGHRDEGYVRGWWTPRHGAQPDPTRDRTGAAR